MPLCTHLALASAPEILLMWLFTHVSHKSRCRPILAAHLSSTPTYPQHLPHLPILNTYLSSTPTYPQHLPILNTYRKGLNPEGPLVRKVSAMRHPVSLGMAYFAPESESMRIQDCRIYRITAVSPITGKFTELGVLSCWA